MKKNIIMQFSESNSFKWFSPYLKYYAEQLAFDLLNKTSVKSQECIITDLDFFLSCGLTVEVLQQNRHITDLESLEERLRESGQDLDSCHFKSMMLRIVNRWHFNMLNNKLLEDKIQQRIVDKIIGSYISGNDAGTCPHINKALDLTVQRITDNKIEKYLSKQDDSLIPIIISALHDDFKEGHLYDDRLINKIEIGARLLFLELFKQQFPSFERLILEGRILDQWVADIEENKVAGVSSLDSYCAELANELKGSTCLIDLTAYLKQAFKLIIQQWRNNSLPPEKCQLFEHVEKYLRAYFHENMRGIQLYDDIISRVIKTLIVNRAAVIKDYLYTRFKQHFILETIKGVGSRQGKLYLEVVATIKDIIDAHRNTMSEFSFELKKILGDIFNVETSYAASAAISRHRLFSLPVVSQQVIQRERVL
jgi:hypothetical protein